MKYPILFFVSFPVSLTFLIVSSAFSCDLCSIYNSVESMKPEPNAVRMSVSEQFTGFDRVQLNGHKVENEGHQHLESSITQLVGSYDISEIFGLQLNIPYINRRFKRIENEAVERGTEAGIGDVTLLGKVSPYRYKDAETTLSIQLLAGLKLPTGDTDRLKEELSEDHHHGDMSEMEELSFLQKHGDADRVDEEIISSAVHGHDLSLGSGSYDFPLGANIFAQLDRTLLLGGLQYVFRTEGDHSYEYADDFTWNVGPAYYLVLGHDYTVAAGLNLSGERKDKDKGRDGESQVDTGIRSIFLGPQLLLTICNNLSGEVSLDLPLDVENSDFQAVPSYKIRAGVTFKF